MNRTPSNNILSVRKNLRLFLSSIVLLLTAFAMSSSAYSQVTFFSENMGNPGGTKPISTYTGWENYEKVTYEGDADVRNSSPSSGYPGASGEGNVYFAIGKYFEISGINASEYTNIQLSLGHSKATTAESNELEIKVSDDGTNYTSLTYSRPTGSGTTGWILIEPEGTIPSAENLRIRFTHTSSNDAHFRIDDITLTGDSNDPYLVVSSLSNDFGDVCINKTAGPETFTVEGNNLNGSAITVGPLDDFQFSLDDITYEDSLEITYDDETLESTLVYVVFTPTLEKAYTDDIPVEGGDADPEVCSINDTYGVYSTPTVNTGDATNIDMESATIAATIDDEGCSSLTEYGIEWSTEQDFELGEGTQVPGNNLSNGEFEVNLTNLPDDTPIYYRAYAENNAGIEYGNEKSFRTNDDSLQAPVALEAEDVKAKSFTAVWEPVDGADSYLLDVYTLGDVDTVVFWDFEDGDQQADGGDSINETAQINGVGTSGSYQYYQGTGGQETFAISTTGWDDGADSKYWEIEVSSEGYTDLTLSSAQRGSDTGPKFFQAQYKIGGDGDWVDIDDGDISVSSSWAKAGQLEDVPLPEECGDQEELHIRWLMTSNEAINGSSVSSSGNNRIDDIYVKGKEITFELKDKEVSEEAGRGGSIMEDNITYSVDGLDEETTYYYRVRAQNNEETSGYSNVIEVSTPLPLTLLKFDVVSNQDKRVALLSWASIQERNTSHFEVLRSTDGRDWEVIGKVQAGGNTLSLSNYNFVDNEPARFNYYRLLCVDLDNSSTLSEIRSASFTFTNNVSIFPNPADTYLIIEADDQVNNFSIINALGVTEKSGTINNSETQIDLSELPAGQYYLKIGNEVQKFIKN